MLLMLSIAYFICIYVFYNVIILQINHLRSVFQMQIVTLIWWSKSQWNKVEINWHYWQVNVKKNRLQMYCMSGVMLFILAMARDLFFTWTKNYPFLLAMQLQRTKNTIFVYCLLSYRVSCSQLWEFMIFLIGNNLSRAVQKATWAKNHKWTSCLTT